MVRRFVYLIFILTLLVGCAVPRNTSINTIDDQENDFHKQIEDTTALKYANQEYKSLAFSEMKVYKPIQFYQLDSIYSIKENYLSNNDYRGWYRTGLEDLIPGYQAAAQEVVNQVQYEFEHIYQTRNKDSIQIHHAFYLFNYKNELINISETYNFNLAPDKINLFYKYQFNQHFITDRDLYISREELDFIQFMKTRENQLAGEKELQSFMNHLINLLEAAQFMQSVNYNEIVKYLVIQHIKSFDSTIKINNIAQLFVNKEEDKIISYQIDVEWERANSTGLLKSTYLLSPYLEIEKVITQEAQK
ncbi:MAG: hypothetical protein M9897_04670 [Brumimicrobium sp.]|nr:hypothetical protein [Brumimicrobium sp.]